MPISHESLPSGQSVASIVYVPASTWTEHVRLSHESTFCVVEPLKWYVPGDGSVTITPGSVPNVLGSPVTRGYRFASSYPPPKRCCCWHDIAPYCCLTDARLTSLMDAVYSCDAASGRMLTFGLAVSPTLNVNDSGYTVMPVGFASPTTAISGLAALAANSCDAASGRIVTLRFLLSPTRRVMLSMGLPESSVTLMDSGA